MSANFQSGLTILANTIAKLKRVRWARELRHGIQRISNSIAIPRDRKSAGRNNATNCFRVRLHPGEPQSYFSYSKSNSLLLGAVNEPDGGLTKW
jgi:hypothetical protein